MVPQSSIVRLYATARKRFPQVVNCERHWKKHIHTRFVGLRGVERSHQGGSILTG